MKINANQIPLEGINLEEEISAGSLDLDTDLVKIQGPIKIKARVSRITNAVTVKVSLNASLKMACSRCLAEFKGELVKELELNYQVEKPEQEIDLDPDIREEIILDYPIKPLCEPGCKGLCPRCGESLNDASCKCSK